MKLIGIYFSLGAMVLLISNSLAHHVESDDFDISTKMILKGKVVHVEWINPHAVIHLEVANDYGVNQLWLVQADTPNTLLRSGINRSSFDSSREVELEVYPPTGETNCTPTCLSYGISVSFRPGHTLSLGRLNNTELP